ncbi:VraH family peptide resistance protein [Staphylococcus capitis]|uniref:VraH family peptide resistance protein n=1 Tax=Staphylococcus capitis TaxID=29388 RepID=UPI00115CBFAC|nr:VraH family protein [Staphylococcus capitis]
MIKKFIENEQKSGYLGILCTLVFGLLFSSMFTPFIGIPAALGVGYLIHTTEAE